MNKSADENNSSVRDSLFTSENSDISNDELVYDSDDEFIEPDDDSFLNDDVIAKPILQAKPKSINRSSTEDKEEVELVINFKDKVFVISISKFAPVLEFKEKLREITGFPAIKQQIIFSQFPNLGDGILIQVLGLKQKQIIRCAVVQDQLMVYIDDTQFKVPPKRNTEQELTNSLEAIKSPSNFVAQFDSLYSTGHPKFATGSFKEALHEAKSKFKLLIIYLHNGEADVTFPFCCGALCAPEVVSLISQSFIFWVGVVQHNTVSEPIRTTLGIKASYFPILGVIGNLKGSLTVVDLLQGIINPDDLTVRLYQIIDNHQGVLNEMRAEYDKREDARQLKAAQDQAYEDSLNADKIKKEQEEKARLEKAKREEEQQLLEEAKQLEEALKIEARENRRRNLLASLPPEPNVGPDSCQIKIRLPDGTRLERRFKSDEKLITVYNFVESTKLHEFEDFTMRLNFPNKLLDRNEGEKTLKELGLVPQAMLNVAVK